jgi:hypothetical protein
LAHPLKNNRSASSSMAINDPLFFTSGMIRSKIG